MSIIMYGYNSEAPTPPSYEAETIAFMTATSTPDDSNASGYGITNHECWELLDSVIKYYKTEGIWADIIHWHPIFGGTAAKHAFNAKNVAEFAMTFTGGWVHSAMGCQANGTNTYASFGFVPANEMSFTDCGLTIVSNTDTNGSSELEFGSTSTPNDRTYIQTRSSGRCNIRIGSTTAGASTNSDARGIYTGTRAGTTVKSYKNLTELSSEAGGGTGLSTVESLYGAYNNAGAISFFSAKQLASASHHKATNIVKIQTGIQMWENGLGRKTW